jgi:methylmalonyl-CoA mutase N-terminal domain/subunit
MKEAIRTEWLDREFEKEALKRQKEIDQGEKLVVGVNIFSTEPETETPLGVQRIPSESARSQIEGTQELKGTRDKNCLKDRIKQLREDTEEGQNVLPAMIEATKAFATTGELMGTVRMGMGYPYDPMEILESPF